MDHLAAAENLDITRCNVMWCNYRCHIILLPDEMLIINEVLCFFRAVNLSYMNKVNFFSGQPSLAWGFLPHVAFYSINRWVFSIISIVDPIAFLLVAFVTTMVMLKEYDFPSHLFLGECLSQRTLMNVRWDSIKKKLDGKKLMLVIVLSS